MPRDIASTLEPSLATVLFTDIVGSTERLTEIGDRGWSELLQEHTERVRREVHRYGGREANTAGDAFLATFQHPARAVRCAWAIRESMRDLGLEMRSGIHAGEVSGSGPSTSGLAVHVAARVASEAEPGEILVSGTVRDLLAGSGIGFEDRGQHVLKGVPGEWRLFALRNLPSGAGAAAAVGWLRPLAARPTLLRGLLTGAVLLGLAGAYALFRDRGRVITPPEALAGSALPGLAVLPFDVSGTGTNEWREGMVDLLSTNLDGIAGVRTIDSRTVLARSREVAPGDRLPDLATSLEIARRAGARYALVGGVVGIGSRVRLTADLYDVSTGRKLGGGQADGVPDSIFGLVDQLSVELVSLIAVEEGGSARAISLSRATTDSLGALKAYLEGEALLRRSDLEGAMRAYERAVEIDSTFALALYRLNIAAGWSDVDLAREYVERANRFAGRLPERQRTVLLASLALERGTLDGLAPLRDAVRRYPDYAEAWFELGELYQHLGPQALVDPGDSERAFSRVLEIDPTFSLAYDHLIETAFGYHADSTRAARLIAAQARLSPGNPTVEWAGIALGLAFGGEAARRDARARLAVLSPGDRYRVARNYLWHPRFGGLQAEIFSPSASPASRFNNALARGSIEEAVGILVDPETSGSMRVASLYTLYAWELPVPERLLEQELGTSGDTSDLSVFYRGAYAVDRQRRGESAAAARRLRSRAAALLAAGDSTRARFVFAAGRAVEGYDAWRAGRRDQALVLLERAQREATAPGWSEDADVNATIRLWLARLCTETDRTDEATRYLRSFWREWGEPREPLAQYELGTILERTGKPDAARASYAYFVLAWRGADPGLQPKVNRARQAIERLGGSRVR